MHRRRQTAQAQIDEDADEDAGDQPGKVQKRQVVDDGGEAHQADGHDELPYIVKETTHSAYAYQRELWVFYFFPQRHDGEAEQASGQAVEEAEQAAKGKGVENVAQKGHSQSREKAKAVQDDDDDQIGQAQFHPRKGQGEREQALDIAEQKGDGSEYRQFRHAAD